jgi:hypothetical protein
MRLLVNKLQTWETFQRPASASKSAVGQLSSKYECWYFEMCEALGTEPTESEIPVEFDDFPLEVQQAFNAYKMLRDEWDTMNGVYLGKSLIGVKDVLEATEVEISEHKFIIMLIRIIDSVRSDEINNKKRTQEPVG